MSLQNAFLGSLVADAVAMPVHWYYNRQSLDQDYGDFSSYCKPKNIHLTASYGEVIILRNLRKQIFWKTKQNIGVKEEYVPSVFGSRRQFTNLQLAARIYRSTILNGTFDPESWLKRYVEVRSPQMAPRYIC